MADSSLAVVAPALPEEMEELRRSRDPAAAEGIPPHLTVLFPFVAAEQLDDGLVGEVERLAAETEPFSYRLAGPELLGGEVAVLVPDPAEPFLGLIRRVMARWPELPPYGGEVAPDDVVPHLTLAHDVTAAEVADLARMLAPHLPIEAEANHLSLLVHRERWSVEHRFPLGGPTER